MPGSFGTCSGPVPIADELGGELVAAVGPDDPRGERVVPLQIGDLGVEQRVVVEPELLADPVAVLEDLRRVRVLLRRHVPGLFEQRHVDHRRRVALRARIAVPVPGAAEVAALLDDPDVVDAGLLQPRAGHQAGEAAADEGHRHVVVLRIALDALGVRVVEIAAELALQLEVLVVAVRSQALVPLLCIPVAQRLGVDISQRNTPSSAPGIGTSQS